MRRARIRSAGLALVALATACSAPTSGPVRIVWGRDACDHCQMAISERRFAAQVRLGPHDVARFDDLGCAIAWLEAHGGPDAALEFWVASARDEGWLDARTAAYRGGQRTPMAYGFAAVEAAAAGAETVDFETARRRILERDRGRPAR